LGVRDSSRAISVRRSLASANRFPAAKDRAEYDRIALVDLAVSMRLEIEHPLAVDVGDTASA
jgi:hypothetical protein